MGRWPSASAISTCTARSASGPSRRAGPSRPGGLCAQERRAYRWTEGLDEGLYAEAGTLARPGDCHFQMAVSSFLCKRHFRFSVSGSSGARAGRQAELLMCRHHIPEPLLTGQASRGCTRGRQPSCGGGQQQRRWPAFLAGGRRASGVGGHPPAPAFPRRGKRERGDQLPCRRRPIPWYCRTPELAGNPSHNQLAKVPLQRFGGGAVPRIPTVVAAGSLFSYPR